MPPGSPNPDPVSDPKMLFSSPVFKSTYPYSDLDVVTKRSVYMGRNYVERFRKIYLNADYSFFFYSFGIETTNTFIYSRSFLVTIPDSRPKWAKSFPVFRPKRRSPYLIYSLYLFYFISFAYCMIRKQKII